MKTLRTSFFAILMGLLSNTLSAQLQYLSTIPPYNGGNGSSMIAFNVKAKNAQIEIKELYCTFSSTSSQTTTIYYKIDSINGTPAVSTWLVAGTVTHSPTTSGIGTMSIIPVPNLSIIIPAGAVYGIAISGSSITYTGTGSTPTTPWLIADSNIYINMGASVGWGGTATSPIQYRHFNGRIGYQLSMQWTDAELQSFIFPTDTICSGSQNVSVVLKNNGPANLVNAKIRCSINNDSIPTFNWTGNLAVNATTNVNIGSFNFQAGVNYNIKAFVTSPNNFPDTINTNDTINKTGVYVKLRPTATPAATAFTMCQGDSVQISGTFTGTPPWNMTVMEGSSPNTFNNLISPGFAMYVSPNSTTTYTVTSLSDATGCVYTATPPIVVTVNPLPAANTGINKAYCFGGSTTLGTVAVSGNTYQWSPATGLNNATVSNPIASPTVTTTYKLVETRTATGCVDSNTVVVTVNPIPVADAGSNQVLATGNTATFNGTATAGIGPYLYSWAPAALFVNPNVQNPTTQILNFSTLFTLTVTDSLSGCSDTDNVMVTISGGPIFSQSSATPTGICTGASSQIQVLSSGGTGTYTYTWSSDPPGFTSASIPNPVVSPTITTKYYVVISDGTLNRTDSITVTVFSNPIALITPAGSTSLCQGNSLQLNATPATGNTYKWFRDNVQISGATLATYTTSIAGSFVVVVTNSTNCVSTSAPVVVVVNPNPTASITPVGPVSVCQGDSVKLTANQGSNLSWQWRQNTLPVTGATDTVFYAGFSGVYSLVVTNQFNCSTTSANQTVTINPIPNSVITPAGSTTICAGSSVMLNANTAAGQTYKWYFGGIQIAGAVSSSYAASQVGSFTLMVTSAANCSLLSAPVSVSQHPTPTSAITAGGPIAFCQGDSVLLTATTNIGTSWQWRRDGVAISGATASSFWAKITGAYTAVAVNAFCSIPSNAINVTASPLPFAAIYPAGSTNLCPGSNVVLNASSGTGYTHQWHKDGVLITGATNSLYVATQAGSYTVVVTASGACTSTSTPVVVAVHPAPAAVLSPAGPIVFCQGDSTVLSASTGAGNSYLWRRDGIIISGATASSYIAKLSGNYAVTITNTPGCTAVTNSVTVTASPLPPAAITPQGPTTFCQGLSVQLNANFDNTFSYQWFKDGTAISGATQANYTALIGGSYRVQVSNSSSCVSLSAPVVVSLLPQPTVNLGPDQSLAASHSLTLDAGAGHTSYQWSTGATTQTLLVTGSQFAYGPHVFSVTVTNADGCANSDSLIINIIDDTSIEGLKGKTSVSVFPNPNQGVFSVRLNGMEGQNAQMRLFDISGRELWTQSAFIGSSHEDKVVNAGILTPGVYFIRVSSERFAITERIVVR